MFKESDKNPQMDMFSSPAGMLQGASLKNYLKNDSWHNMFREHVITRVNEDIFSVLYSSDNGCPNASIRVLVGMMILKEGQAGAMNSSSRNATITCQSAVPRGL